MSDNYGENDNDYNDDNGDMVMMLSEIMSTLYIPSVHHNDYTCISPFEIL